MYNQHHYQITYIEEGKEKRFSTSVANNIFEAMKSDCVKGDIVKAENIDYYRCCDKCFKNKPVSSIRGDGWCDRHGKQDFRFYISNERQPCPRCAEELKLCIWCGTKLEQEK